MCDIENSRHIHPNIGAKMEAEPLVVAELCFFFWCGVVGILSCHQLHHWYNNETREESEERQPIIAISCPQIDTCENSHRGHKIEEVRQPVDEVSYWGAFAIEHRTELANAMIVLGRI